MQIPGDSATHVVGVLALHGLVAFDLALACDTFAWVQVGGRRAYQVRVCGEAPNVKAGLFDMRVPWELGHIRNVDTLIVPGHRESADADQRRSARRRPCRGAAWCARGVDMQRCVRACGRGTARRPARDDALARGP